MSMVGLHIDLNGEALDRLSERFALDERQLQAAYSRALKRTAGTLRSMSSKGLKGLLGLRNTKRLRRRIKTRRARGDGSGAAFEIWYGQNDWPAEDFKGRPTESGAGVQFLGHSFEGAFIGRLSGTRTILRRKTARSHPIERVLMPVKDRMDVYLEDEVFDQAEEIFMRHFEAEIRARALFGIGAR
ncbi:phage tail protein [Paracoccus homiensis]|nr:phage tail protein [Paracoccus homiensis]